jgi:transcriptional regulator with XRE-family HTH domain
MKDRLANYVRAHRKRVGLSQRELAFMLGYGDESAVAKHESFRAVPPLLIALAYEIIFQVPAGELFAGFREVVEASVEQRIAEFKARMEAAGTGMQDRGTTRKLAWLRSRHKLPS